MLALVHPCVLCLFVFHFLFLFVKWTMAYVTAKVWMSLQRTEDLGFFFDLLSKENEEKKKINDSFICWFAKTSYDLCCKNYSNIRINRAKDIWTTMSEQMEEAKKARSRSRKRKVSQYLCIQ